MTTSNQTLWKSISSLEDTKINPVALGYFHGRAQDEAHELVVKLFSKLAKEKGITRAFLSRRLDKSPEQITRWLSASGNWTLDTLTNLGVAMGHRPVFSFEELDAMRVGNEHHPAVDHASSVLKALATEPVPPGTVKRPTVSAGTAVTANAQW